MAQPANTFDSYDYANAINEDISQIIHNVTPYDTPFYSCLLYTSDAADE